MDIKKEREAFEKHASKFFTDQKEAFKTQDGRYFYDEAVWLWDCWVAAKAQAVPEGFKLISLKDISKLAISISQIDLKTYSPSRSNEDREMWTKVGKQLEAMIEAQEQKTTELKVEWASDCFECGHHEAIIYSTASEASTKGWFHDGDAVKCCKCGHAGEMDARGEDSDICWNENEAQEPAND